MICLKLFSDFSGKNNIIVKKINEIHMKKTFVCFVLLIAVAGFSFGQVSNEIPVDPNFKVTVAGKSDGPISIEQLVGASLTAEKSNYNVEGFYVEYVHPSGDITEKVANGSQIPQSWDTWLSTLLSGQKLFFTNIMVRGDDGSIRKAPVLSFIIE
jgi:hypothetical protein